MAIIQTVPAKIQIVIAQKESSNKMIFTSTYPSLIGNLTIAVQNDKLIGIWIENQKYEKQNIKEEMITAENNQTINKTKDWLDQYFAKKRPNIKELDLKPIGSTFRRAVWDILTEIPYGTVTTYKDVTIKVAKKLKVDKMSAQAVGAAIAHNPISIIIPCHRVIGTNKKLTGYAGGLDKKLFLLEHEQVDKKKYKR